MAHIGEVGRDRGADTVEDAIHHLEGGGHADGPFCGLRSDRGDERITLGPRIGPKSRGQSVGESQKLGPGGQGRRAAFRHDGQIDGGCVATRPEEAGVSEQSIEALVEVGDASSDVLDLALRQNVAVLAVADLAHVDVHGLMEVAELTTLVG